MCYPWHARRRRLRAPAALLLQVWLPGDEVEEGETLQYDPSVYDCLSTLTLDWPSLSFDLLRDHLGAPRAAFPHTLFMVAGTQVGAGVGGWGAGGLGWGWVGVGQWGWG